MRKSITAALVVGAAAVMTLTSACDPASEKVSENLSTAADNFEVDRRIVFINGITDKYLLTIEGKCSITDQGSQLEVTCKTGTNPDTYKKHFLGKSDNVPYLVEQLDNLPADDFRTRIVLRPENIIPDFDLQTSGG